MMIVMMLIDSGVDDDSDDDDSEINIIATMLYDNLHPLFHTPNADPSSTARSRRQRCSYLI